MAQTSSACSVAIITAPSLCGRLSRGYGPAPALSRSTIDQRAMSMS
jgi:hypothetical protein